MAPPADLLAEAKPRSQVAHRFSTGEKFIFGVGALFFFVVVLETSSFWILKVFHQKPRPFLLNLTSYYEGILEPQYSNTYNALDPHLGYALLPPFVVYGDPSPDAFRIVVLGGSTTDPTVQSRNWAAQLSEVLRENGIHAQVYNGGVGGYSSHQELLKLIRDVKPMRPQLVLSLNGVNDTGLYSLKKHPMVHPYQNRLFQFLIGFPARDPILLPNTVSLLEGLARFLQEWLRGHPRFQLSYGSEVEESPASQWSDNMHMMEAVSQAFGMRYLCFLQPLLGYGAYEASPAENAMLVQTEQALGSTYLEQVKRFYGEARRICQERSESCADLVDLFQGRTGLYENPRHPSPEGHRLLSEAIFAELEKRNLLPSHVRNLRPR